MPRGQTAAFEIRQRLIRLPDCGVIEVGRVGWDPDVREISLQPYNRHKDKAWTTFTLLKIAVGSQNDTESAPGIPPIFGLGVRGKYVALPKAIIAIRMFAFHRAL